MQSSVTPLPWFCFPIATFLVVAVFGCYYCKKLKFWGGSKVGDSCSVFYQQEEDIELVGGEVTIIDF